MYARRASKEAGFFYALPAPKFLEDIAHSRTDPVGPIPRLRRVWSGICIRLSVGQGDQLETDVLRPEERAFRLHFAGHGYVRDLRLSGLPSRRLLSNEADLNDEMRDLVAVLRRR